MSTKDVSYG